MRRDAKKDVNHNVIVNALQGIGCKVIDCAAVGQLIPNFPDILIAYAGHTLPMEIKSEGKQLTKGQKDFHAEYQRYAPILKAESEEEAIHLVLTAVGRKPRHALYTRKAKRETS